MDILIDTNAVLATGIESQAFRSLKNYLRTTRSTLLIPAVVIEELCAKNRIAIEQLSSTLRKAYKEMHHLFPHVKAKPPVLKAARAMDLYRQRITALSDQTRILENKREDLRELIRRLANRIPPASQKGEEARDVLIWLTVLRVVRKRHIAFITADNHFTPSGALSPELLTDLGNFRDNLEVFPGINEFLHKHHSRSSFIDKGWIEGRLGKGQIDKAIEEFIDLHPDMFMRKIEAKGEPSGYISLIQVVQYDIEDFFVSDVDVNELYVSVIIWAELEVEVEVEYYGREGRWTFRETRTGSTIECIYPEVRAQVQLRVVGNDVMALDVASLELSSEERYIFS
jgi:hypothetical protein